MNSPGRFLYTSTEDTEFLINLSQSILPGELPFKYWGKVSRYYWNTWNDRFSIVTAMAGKMTGIIWRQGVISTDFSVFVCSKKANPGEEVWQGQPNPEMKHCNVITRGGGRTGWRRTMRRPIFRPCPPGAWASSSFGSRTSAALAVRRPTLWENNHE
jgi:hypothetical protein